MAASENGEVQSPLEYGCTEWRRSSQLASNLFREGHKLWTKEDLRYMEQQLAESRTRKVFTVRSMDGKMVSIKKPHVRRTVADLPRVRYQDYWRLLKMQPDGPPETYLCPYLVEWVNISARDFRGVVDDPMSAFEETRAAWSNSATCESLKSRLENLHNIKKVKNVVCFGLGDICLKPPEWLQRHLFSEGQPETSFVHPSMVQHLMTLEMAEICRKISGNNVQLLAQYPGYTEQAQDMLRAKGFSIVGQFGAEGFAEIDEYSVVFSVFVEAPLKQIIVDTARPLLITSTGFEVFNNFE